MSHVRKQALDAFVTALAGLPTTGLNVFLGRVTPLQREEVPGHVVRGGGEAVEAETFPRPRLQQRRYQVDVLVHVRETDDYEEKLNDAIGEVEIALAPPSVASSFGAKTITLRNIDPPIRVQNEVTYVQAAMNYEVFYITAENAPDVAL